MVVQLGGLRVRKLKSFLIILCSVIAVALVVLAALTYIPLTRTLEYDMRGYVIQPDGQIVEEFTFTMTGKEYDFIIDPPGGAIQFAGEKLEKLERDAFILSFNWGSATFSENYHSGNYTGDYHRADHRYVYGTLHYYSGTTNSSHLEPGILDLEDGTFCMYADDLVDNCFIVGISVPDTDPLAVMEYWQSTFTPPKLQSSGEN